jgi:hypothetical protein
VCNFFRSLVHNTTILLEEKQRTMRSAERFAFATSPHISKYARYMTHVLQLGPILNLLSLWISCFRNLVALHLGTVVLTFRNYAIQFPQSDRTRVWLYCSCQSDQPFPPHYLKFGLMSLDSQPGATATKCAFLEGEQQAQVATEWEWSEWKWSCQWELDGGCGAQGYYVALDV